MNRLQPIRLPVVVMALLMLALSAGVFYFLAGMNQATYVLSDGVRLGVQYLDKPRYDMHLQGLIFSVSFLIAGGLLLLLVLLPDQDGRAGASSDAPPQPRRQPAGAPQPAAAAAAAQAVQPPPASGAPAPAAAQTTQSSPLTIEPGESEGEAPAAPAAVAPSAVPEAPEVSVEEQVLRSAGTSDDLPTLDIEKGRFDDSGEEDVVYGAGRVTEDAIWEFVQLYPDSAVKFLYRKTLDNKVLSPTEEDIYRNWEVRGMSRAKVREIVLEIMRWQSLPDNFPHEIWRELRDQIYEMKIAAK